ncbi:hypothetical protein QF035_001490 [Streptomyces umbrinus]|uniref:Lipoprotein n=1 Tax=Streptomyces umbrinus TaxID=67370 RepID=A0ABU0SK09_9ACTN|nr:hypothetical protein [Streptomyces umbrinus]
MRTLVHGLRAHLTVLVLLACGFAALAPVSNGP